MKGLLRRIRPGQGPSGPAPQDPQATPAEPGQPQPSQALPAGVDPAEAVPANPSFRHRGRLRRRLRYLRRVRELGFRDLGGLVYDLHRFGRRNDELVLGKLAGLDAVDRELRAIEHAIQEHRDIIELREPGVAACPRCGALHGTDARFCPMCGTQLSGPLAIGGVAPGAPAPAAATAPPPASEAPTTATSPATTPAEPATATPVTTALRPADQPTVSIPAVDGPTGEPGGGSESAGAAAAGEQPRDAAES